jgi:hypothetical protein
MEPIVRKLVLTLMMVAAAAAPLVATADVDEEARAQFDRGMELYDAGHYEEAAIAFERAYELKPSYKILYNWAQAENENGRYALALDAYERYLSEGGADLEPERVEQVRAEIKRLKTLVGTLIVKCPEEGAVVMVDGRRQGQTPIDAPITVKLGEREVVVKLGGKEIHREVVRVAGGEQVKIVVEAQAEEAALEPVQPVEPDPLQDEGRGRVWTWVALGVAGAAGIAGGVIGGVSIAKRKEFIDECGNHTCDDSYEDDRDQVKTLSLTADILYGVAGAAAVTAVILFFAEPDAGVEDQVAVAPAAVPGGAGLNVSGRF